ncbi:hypothetical protein [Plantibacter sp. RU18]|uniref:hypothetical protein n=1 Tax=Plantibacter sp. RU18 TaxID=3158143 RepID=UPI003D36AD68
MAVTLVAFVMLKDLLYRLIGRETWSAAIYVLAPMLLAGMMLFLMTVGIVLPSEITSDATALEPVARAVLLLPVISISGPFLLLSPLTGQLPVVRQDGLIFHQVLRRLRRALYAAERRVGRASEDGDDRGVEEHRLRPFAWAGIVAFVPILPFNLMFAGLAFKLAREHAYRGRIVAWLGLVLGSLFMVAIVASLVLVLVLHLSLVGCSDDPQSLCLARSRP